MRVAFLPSAEADLKWFVSYYRHVFPEGTTKARASLDKSLSLLLTTPMMGRVIAEGVVREYAVPRTPFSLIYRLVDDRIEVLRLWDQRAERPDHWTDQ